MMIVLVIKLKSPIEMKLAWRSGQKLGLVACLFAWLVETCLSNMRLSGSACFVNSFLEKEKGGGVRGRLGLSGFKARPLRLQNTMSHAGKRLNERCKSESKQDVPDSIYYVTNQEGLQEIADPP